MVQGESGRDGGLAPWPEGAGEKFDEPRILLLEEARHHLANESEGLRRRYFDFLSDVLGGLEFQAAAIRGDRLVHRQAGFSAARPPGSSCGRPATRRSSRTG